MTATQAAIDIGSNSTHLVVAETTPTDVHILEDKVALVRLGETVNENGTISSDRQHEALQTLHDYHDLAQQHHADPMLVIATEAIRKAKNSQDFIEAVKHETGLEVHIIGGNIESVLTFLGATYEQKREVETTEVAVMDVGGGSTELVLAKEMHITWLKSVPFGSGMLHDRYLHSDPPTQEEVQDAEEFLHRSLQEMNIRQHPKTLIVTGSSASTLLHLAQQAFGKDEQSSDMSYDDMLRCEGLLCATPAEEVARRYTIESKRAQVLPAGAMIIRAVMHYLGLEAIRVSSHGVREGALLAYARYGDAWLTHPEINIDPKQLDREQEETHKTFADAGREELPKRVEKFLDWRDDVLQNKDIEPVHKMRVASRRLRATLDAYEACCKPKPFKKVYRQVQKAADLLGIARDTDVMMQQLAAYQEQAPTEERAGIHWFYAHLRKYRRQQQQVVQGFLQKLDEQQVEQAIAACIPEEGANHGKS